MNVLRPVPLRRERFAPASLVRAADQLVPPLALAVLAVLFFWARARDPLLPVGSQRSGWEAWYDQYKYLEAMRAWLAGDLRPLHHWYMPGYPLLGALFHAVTPRDPFVIPDLMCLVATGWLLARLGARLAGPGGAALGAVVFLAATEVSRTALEIWIVPWSSTPVAPLALGLLLAALRFAERPNDRDALLAGLAAGGIPWFRPTDLAVVALPAGALMAWALLRTRAGPRGWVRTVAAGAGGAGALLLALLAVHLAIFGPVAGGYMDLSRHFGFEWGLVPLRWVTLVVDPEPLFPGQRSLVMAFPWIVPGLAGLLALVVAPGRAGRAATLAVAGAVALQFALLLAYRDISLFGLFRYNNYHYFKWLLPVLALYAALLPGALASRGRRAGALLGCAGTAILVCWKPGLVDQHPVAAAQSEHELVLPGGLPSVWDALLVPATGHASGSESPAQRIWSGDHHLLQGGVREDMLFDFRLYPVSGGFMVTPLRAFPPGDLTLQTGPETVMDTGDPAIRAVQHLAFRPPCWIFPNRAACRPILAVAPHILAPGATLRFDGSEDSFLIEGWANPSPDGRWTDGRDAMLAMRVPGLRPGEGVTLEADAGGYVPARDRHPLDAGVIVNGKQVADWHPESGTARSLTAQVPASLIGAGGELDVQFHIENPREPARFGEGPDFRDLGLDIHALRVVPSVPPTAPLP